MSKHLADKPLPVIHDRKMQGSNRILGLEQLELEFSNGVERTYFRMQTHGLGAVIIVPLLDPDTVLLAREYAAGLHHYELGLPKGRLEEGETILEAANREMKEEIGYGARRLEELTALSLAPGYMTHMTHIVLARDLYEEKLEGDEPEEIDVVPWSLSALPELTARPDCTEGRTIASLYITRDFLRKEAKQ